MARRTIPLRSILALLVLAPALPLGLYAATLIQGARHQQRELVERQNVATARAVSSAVDQQVESALAALGVIASVNELDGADLRSFRELALRVLPQQDGWRALLLVEPDGRVRVSTAARPGESPVLENAEWVREIAESHRSAVSNLAEDPATRRFYVTVGVPVIRGGKLRFALGAELGTEALSDVLRRQNPPENGVVTLIDREPRIIARTRGEAEFVGKPPSPRFAAASQRMSEGSWDEVLLEGTRAYASLSRSPRTGWTVGIGFPAETIDGPIRRSIYALAGVGLGVLGLGVAAAFLLARLVVGALRSASRAGKALASSQPLEFREHRVAEFDELARALAEAAAILDARLHERDTAQRERERAAGEREQALLAERDARTASEKDQARLDVTLRSIGDAVIATDASGHVTLLNPVAQGLTGWSEAAASGEPIERVFHIVNEHSRRPVENPVSKVFREGGVVGLANHTCLIARDGSERPIEDSAGPIRAADGTLLGVVLVFRDVSERRDAERARLALLEQEQSARRHAEALSQSKDEFVATVSHELRNPLNAIFGWVKLLRSGSLDAAATRRAMDVIERNTVAQAQLIDDLLDMSRVITGKLRLEMRRLDLAAAAEAAIESVRPTAEAKELQIEFVLGDLPGPVLGDPDRIQQVLWNLLTNSIKFTPKAGRIELRLGSEGGEARIDVSDTGIGIAKELLPHVFERFRQGQSSEARSHGGLGIGLALVRHLVELHSGRVEAHSEGEGRGATFSVRLPLLGERAQHVADPPGAGSRLVGNEGRPLLEGLHVLVVDDDPDARDLVSTALRQSGARITVAASGSDALAVLESVTPDVVVTDIAMPGGTGYDLLKQIRGMEHTAALPVVALTAYSRLEDRERALRAGFDSHLGKPFEPLALARVIAFAAREHP